jgi:hypothetical protein
MPGSVSGSVSFPDPVSASGPPAGLLSLLFYSFYLFYTIYYNNEKCKYFYAIIFSAGDGIRKSSPAGAERETRDASGGPISFSPKKRNRGKKTGKGLRPL